MKKKLTVKAINEVLDLAFQKLPFHVYLVMCDVGEASLKLHRKRKIRSGKPYSAHKV